MNMGRVQNIISFMSLRAFVRSGAFLMISAVFLSTDVAVSESPFYLTFERSFSAREPAVVRLDYTMRDKPFHVRVLRPKNIESFLDGQLNISRTYEEPRAALNPGHYLAEGLNKISSPAKSFQRLLSPEFRLQWNATLSPPLQETGEKPRVATPKRVVHEPPLGFEVVKDLYIDMQRGGTEANDTWWWFFDQAPESGEYSVRSVSLGELQSGLYLVQAVQEDNEAQALLQVSEVSLQVKQSSRDLTVRAVNRSAKPVSGATISVRNARGKWTVLPVQTDESGSAVYRSNDTDLDSKLIVRAALPDGTTAFADTDFVSLRPDANSMFVATDRPIFRPGEEVGFKGVIRELSNGALTIPAAHDPATVSLLRQDGTLAGTVKDVHLSEFGSLSGTFAVGEDESPGLYRVVADVAGKPYAGELRVRDYVKPTFYLDMVDHTGALRPGQKFSYTLRSRRYAGGAPQGGRYEVFVYRKKFEVPKYVEDAGGGLATGTDYFGGTQSAAALGAPQRIYSSIEERTPPEERESMGEAWNSAPTFDLNGDAHGEITLPPIPDDKPNQEWTYTILFRAMDRTGAQAVLSENFYQTVADGVVAGRFNTAVVAPGVKDARFNVRVTTPDGDGMSGVKGNVEFALQGPGGAAGSNKVPFTTDKLGYATITVPPYDKVGVLTAIASATGVEGKPWASEARSAKSDLLIIGDHGEAVRSTKDVILYADTTIVSPGEKTKVYAILPDNWGDTKAGSDSLNKGTIWRTVAGTQIHSSTGVGVTGRSYSYDAVASEEFGTGFFETITVPVADGKFRESTLGFRVIPWKKRLKVSIVPEKAVGEPMRPFLLKALVKDSAGNPAPGVEVGLGVVDRAVYAVQPEFRPALVDFFFPMPRLNLMSFYSDELQGYGYADAIRKPNFSLTAIKAQSKLSKRAVRDTAGWYPHLVTDSNGEVSVSVPMPANLTEWLVTATAVDKQGRVGEGTGQFRTALDVAVEPQSPQFIRSGDTLSLPVSVHNQGSATTTVSLSAVAKHGDNQVGALNSSDVVVASQGTVERILPIKAADSNEPLLMAFNVTSAAPALVGGEREFELATLPQSVPITLTGATTTSESLTFTIPQDARASNISVTVTRGLLGVVLARARDLVTYPYGCAEQLSHTISPNLALLQLAEAIPEIAQEFGEFRSLVTKARANAVTGISKLLAMQKENGGFSLWPSDKDASPAVTLMVNSVLRQASAVSISEADRPMWKAAAWLEKGVSRDSWSPYELTQLAEMNSNVNATAAQVKFVRDVLANTTPSLAEITSALLLVRRYKEMSWHAFNRDLGDAHAGTHLTTKLIAAIGAAPLRDVQVSRAWFSPEDLGFNPVRTQVFAAALSIVEGMKPVPSAVREQLRRQIFDDLKEGMLWSPFDAAEVITRIIPSVIAELKEDDSKGDPIAVSDRNGEQVLLLKKIRGGYAGTAVIKPLEKGEGSAALGTLSVQLPKRAAAPKGSEGSPFAIVGTLEVAAPFSSVQTLEQGVGVKRELLRVTGAGVTPLNVSTSLKKGDVVVSRITVQRSPTVGVTGVIQPSDWFVVQDSVPSLADSIDDEGPYLADAKLVAPTDSYWSSVKETLRYPDRTERVVKLLPGGTFTTYSVWRVRFDGDAGLAPARAFNMYERGTQGLTMATRVTAKE